MKLAWLLWHNTSKRGALNAFDRLQTGLHVHRLGLSMFCFKSYDLGNEGGYKIATPL